MLAVQSGTAEQRSLDGAILKQSELRGLDVVTQPRPTGKAQIPVQVWPTKFPIGALAKSYLGYEGARSLLADESLLVRKARAPCELADPVPCSVQLDSACIVPTAPRMRAGKTVEQTNTGKHASYSFA